MTIQDYINKGITVRNNMGEIRRTREGSIVFPNGWVASIVNPDDGKYKYSVAVCDYDGYFDWNILRPHGASEKGTFLCNSEQEVCDALTIIENI